MLKETYEIHGVLGEGGFGIVYLAYHRPSDTVMALKTFRDGYFDDQETRDLFRKEAQILVDVDPHPHLVRAYLVDEIHGRLFVALEFIAPDQDRLNTLEGHLKRRPPELAQSLRWAIQFCHGMEFAESRGLRCHRDIKPANIMIDGGGRLLVSDFGLAGALSRSVTATHGAGASGQDRGELELDPTHGPTWLDKGRHVEAKRWPDALACMEKVVEFEPEWPLGLDQLWALPPEHRASR